MKTSPIRWSKPLEDILDESRGAHAVMVWKIDLWCPPHPDHPEGKPWGQIGHLDYLATPGVLRKFTRHHMGKCPVHGITLLQSRVERVTFDSPGDFGGASQEA